MLLWLVQFFDQLRYIIISSHIQSSLNAYEKQNNKLELKNFKDFGFQFFSFFKYQLFLARIQLTIEY